MILPCCYKRQLVHAKSTMDILSNDLSSDARLVFLCLTGMQLY